MVKYGQMETKHIIPVVLNNMSLMETHGKKKIGVDLFLLMAVECGPMEQTFTIRKMLNNMF